MALNTNAYEELKKRYNSMADTSANQQIAKAKEDAQSNLKQAYITKMQNQQTVNKQLADAGIRGGMTETANLGVANTYANNRANINSTLAGNIQNARNTAETNKLQYAQEIDTKKQQAIENYDAEQRAYAREDANTNYARQEANLTALYSKFYDTKKLEKALKAATTPLERQVINARLGYIAQHKHNY